MWWLRNHDAVPARLGTTDPEARKLLLHLQEERVWVLPGEWSCLVVLNIAVGGGGEVAF